MSVTGSLGSDLLRRLARLVVLSRRTFRGAGHGQRRARQAGVSTEFRDHRLYAPGDDLRHLDWHLYARLDRLYLKRFHDQQDVTLHVVLDASASMRFGEPSKWDATRRIAAALGYIALCGQDRVVVHALTDGGVRSSVAYRGKGQARRMLAALDAMETTGRLEWESSLTQVARRIRAPGIVVVLGDFLTAMPAAGLERLAAGRHQLHVVRVLSPQEVEPASEASLVGDLKLVDSETGADVAVSPSPHLLRLYAEALADHDAQLGATARRLGATLSPVLSSDSLENVVLQQLQVHGVLA